MNFEIEQFFSNRERYLMKFKELQINLSEIFDQKKKKIPYLSSFGNQYEKLKDYGPIPDIILEAGSSGESSPDVSVNEDQKSKRQSNPSVKDVVDTIIDSSIFSLQTNIHSVENPTHIYFANVKQELCEEIFWIFFKEKFKYQPQIDQIKESYFLGSRGFLITFHSYLESNSCSNIMADSKYRSLWGIQHQIFKLVLTGEQQSLSNSIQMAKLMQRDVYKDLNRESSKHEIYETMKTSSDSQYISVVFRNIPKDGLSEYIKQHFPKISLVSLEDPLSIKGQYCTIVRLNSLEEAEQLCVKMNNSMIQDYQIKVNLNMKTVRRRTEKKHSHFKDLLWDKQTDYRLKKLILDKLNKQNKNDQEQELLDLNYNKQSKPSIKGQQKDYSKLAKIEQTDILQNIQIKIFPPQDLIEDKLTFNKIFTDHPPKQDAESDNLQQIQKKIPQINNLQTDQQPKIQIVNQNNQLLNNLNTPIALNQQQFNQPSKPYNQNIQQGLQNQILTNLQQPFLQQSIKSQPNQQSINNNLQMQQPNQILQFLNIPKQQQNQTQSIKTNNTILQQQQQIIINSNNSLLSQQNQQTIKTNNNNNIQQQQQIIYDNSKSSKYSLKIYDNDNMNQSKLQNLQHQQAINNFNYSFPQQFDQNNAQQQIQQTIMQQQQSKLKSIQLQQQQFQQQQQIQFFQQSQQLLQKQTFSNINQQNLPVIIPQKSNIQMSFNSTIQPPKLLDSLEQYTNPNYILNQQEIEAEQRQIDMIKSVLEKNKLKEFNKQQQEKQGIDYYIGLYESQQNNDIDKYDEEQKEESVDLKVELQYLDDHDKLEIEDHLNNIIYGDHLEIQKVKQDQQSKNEKLQKRLQRLKALEIE